MNSIQIEQKSYEMPPRDGFTVTHFITVADIDRSADFYEKVFGGRILSRGDSKGASGYIQIANTWLIVNVGGPSSSRSRRKNTARFAATSAILTAISSRSDRAPPSPTVNARLGWDTDFKGCGCPLGPESADEHCLSEIGAVNERHANRTKEL